MDNNKIQSVLNLSIEVIMFLKVIWFIFKIVVGVAIIYIACKVKVILEILRDLHYYQRNKFESEFEIEEDEEKETIITKILKKLND